MFHAKCDAKDSYAFGFVLFFSLGVKVEFFWLTKVTTPSTVVLISCSCIGVGRGKWIFWLLFAFNLQNLREKKINSHFM